MSCFFSRFSPWNLLLTRQFPTMQDEYDHQHGHQTVKLFLDPQGTVDLTAAPQTATALRVQASVLFEHAARLVSHAGQSKCLCFVPLPSKNIC